MRAKALGVIILSWGIAPDLLCVPVQQRPSGYDGVAVYRAAYLQHACSDTLSHKLDVGKILQRGKNDGETLSL